MSDDATRAVGLKRKATVAVSYVDKKEDMEEGPFVCKLGATGGLPPPGTEFRAWRKNLPYRGHMMVLRGRTDGVDYIGANHAPLGYYPAADACKYLLGTLVPVRHPGFAHRPVRLVDRERAGDQGLNPAALTVLLLSLGVELAQLRVTEAQPVMGPAQADSQFALAGALMIAEARGAAKIARRAEAEDARGESANRKAERTLHAVALQSQPAAHGFLE